MKMEPNIHNKIHVNVSSGNISQGPKMAGVDIRPKFHGKYTIMRKLLMENKSLQPRN